MVKSAAPLGVGVHADSVCEAKEGAPQLRSPEVFRSKIEELLGDASQAVKPHSGSVVSKLGIPVQTYSNSWNANAFGGIR